MHVGISSYNLMREKEAVFACVCLQRLTTMLPVLEEEKEKLFSVTLAVSSICAQLMFSHVVCLYIDRACSWLDADWSSCDSRLHVRVPPFFFLWFFLTITTPTYLTTTPQRCPTPPFPSPLVLATCMGLQKLQCSFHHTHLIALDCVPSPCCEDFRVTHV